MKTFSKLLSILVVITILLSCFTFNVSAAKSATLFFSDKAVNTGDSVTVSVNIDPDEAMTSVSFYLEYDSSLLKYESGDGTLSSEGTVEVNKALENQNIARYSFKFTGLKAGKSLIAISRCVYKEQGNAEKSFSGASAYLTVKGEQASSDATLKSLKIEGYSISPSFSSSVTSYKATVPYDVKNISVTASTTDADAKIKGIDGNTNLKVGKNTVTVTVKAADDSQKKYTIDVTREKEAEDTSSKEETTEAVTTGLETIIDGNTFSIVTEIPEDTLLNGFMVEETDVNGYTIETAVDSKSVYRIFYLIPEDSEELIPYFYNAETDTFDAVKYITIGNNSYIIDSLPEDLKYPESLYSSNVTVGDFEVECLADTTAELNSFKYIYCYYNGDYSLYRYDTKELTLQRYPDFQLSADKEAAENDNIFTRFNSLSTNGKVIMIALLVVILGILGLLVLLIVYLIRRSLNRDDLMVYSDDDNDDDFDEVEVQNDNATV